MIPTVTVTLLRRFGYILTLRDLVAKQSLSLYSVLTSLLSMSGTVRMTRIILQSSSWSIVRCDSISPPYALGFWSRCRTKAGHRVCAVKIYCAGVCVGYSHPHPRYADDVVSLPRLSLTSNFKNKLLLPRWDQSELVSLYLLQ